MYLLAAIILLFLLLLYKFVPREMYPSVYSYSGQLDEYNNQVNPFGDRVTDFFNKISP